MVSLSMLYSVDGEMEMEGMEIMVMSYRLDVCLATSAWRRHVRNDR